MHSNQHTCGAVAPENFALNRAHSANYLYIIAGVPMVALLIAMAPALQARYHIPFDAVVRGVAGLLLQAVPFTLIGVLVSAAVETWVTAGFIEKHMPRSTAEGFLIALLAGVMVPVCDCVVVPTFSRLVARKLPIACAVTFLCAVPAVNPVVLLATWFAFADIPSIVVIRVALGIAIALLVGLSFVIVPPRAPVLRDSLLRRLETSGEIQQSLDFRCVCDNTHNHHVSRETISKTAFIRANLVEYARHVVADIQQLVPIVLAGSVVASIIRTWLGNDPASRIDAGTALIAIPVMMFIAYASSLCSSSDAVIARSLAVSLPISSVLVFLLFGPMLDLKNTLMLIVDCKPRFVARLTLSITFACFLAAWLTHWAWGILA